MKTLSLLNNVRKKKAKMFDNKNRSVRQQNICICICMIYIVTISHVSTESLCFWTADV